MKKIGLAMLALSSTALLAFACGGSSDVDVPAQSTSPTEPEAPNGDPNAPPGSGDPGSGSAGQGVAPNPADPAIVSACNTFADALCTRTKACAPGLYPALYANDASCVATNAKRCAKDAASPGVKLDANSTNACAASLATLSCEDLIDERLPAVCRPAGTLVAGAACVSGLQCQSGFCAGLGSSGGKGNICGVCAVPTASGGACVAGTCPAGFTCSKNLCVARKKIGDACKATSECGTGQVCANGTTCAAAGSLGSLCALDADCDVLQGLRCSFTTNKCTQLAIVDVGQSCGFTADTGALCRASDCAASGVCIARAKEGAACSVSTRCESGLACVGAKCAQIDASLCK